MTGQPPPEPNPEDLQARLQRTRAYLRGFMSRDDSPLELAVSYLLQSQRPDGSWGAPDYPAWTDVITALAVQALTSCGFTRRSAWDVNSQIGGPQFIGGIEPAARFLLASQRSDGWGEDMFDTCQVTKALLALGPGVLDSDRTDAVISICSGYLDADASGIRRSEWEGSGVVASVVDVASLAGDRDLLARSMAHLASSQNDDGCFGPPTASRGLRVWHTTNAALALHGQGTPLSAATLGRAIGWIGANQNEDGSWGDDLQRHRTIFTAYGAMALTAVEGPAADRVKSAVGWLVGMQSKDDGSVGGMEGTVMAALAFSRTFARPTVGSLPFTEILNIDRVLAEADALAGLLHARDTELKDLAAVVEAAELAAARDRAEASRARDDLNVASERVGELSERIRAEDDKYLFRLTNKRAGQIGFIIGLLGLLSLPSIVKDCSGDGDPPVTTTSVVQTTTTISSTTSTETSVSPP